MGESEKNIREVFDVYRRKVRTMDKAPILLFNEADAVISKRLTNVQHSVDQMNNAIQNIILQEMEKLDGIMIATTNLTANLDNAFERRFLYKVRFDKPSPEAKSHIWQTMLPDLSDEQALQLATDFDFSGGQIENVSRKQKVNAIFNGGEFNFSDIVDFCKEECIGADTSHRRVGF
ncbi:MAG: ATP-binding protein [Bacteroidales bacterium]|nr:ATP-binding protein [Bacteroidales bacterium]